MDLQKKLSAVLVAISLFTANCVYADDNSVSNKTEAITSFQSELEADRAELESVRAELAALAATSQKSTSTKAELESLKAQIEAIKAEKAIASYQAELQAKAELDAIKSELALISSSSQKTDTLKVDLEAAKAELASAKIVAAQKAEIANLDASHKAELEAVKSEVAALGAYKSELELVKAELAAIKAEFGNKATTPVLGMEDQKDVYVPQQPMVEYNKRGDELWASKSEDRMLLDATSKYNYKTFQAELSMFGRHEWSHFSDAQKVKAMQFADRTQMTPDSAVFVVDENY